MGNLIDTVDRLGVQDPDPFAKTVDLALPDDQPLVPPTIDIVDPENPDAALGNIRLPEGEVGLWAVKITDAAGGSTLSLTLSDGTATLSDNDYTLDHFQYSLDGGATWTNVAGPFAIPAGDSLLLVRTDTVADKTFEGDETFFITGTLTGPGGASISATGTATIYDNTQDITITIADTRNPSARKATRHNRPTPSPSP